MSNNEENDALQEEETEKLSDEQTSSAQEKTAGSYAESLRILEALLFASDDVMSTAKLKTLMPDKPDSRQIRKMVADININLQKQRHPFEILEIAGGYQFRTIPYYQPWIQRIFKDKAAKRLSIQALECLAIVAYKQPITKSQIEAIRGVLSDGAVKTLLEKRLVTISGRSDKPGNPLLYTTTQEFLQYFGINKLSDLPNIEEFEAIAKEKMEEEFSNESDSVDDTAEEEEYDGDEPQDNNTAAENVPEKEFHSVDSDSEPSDSDNTDICGNSEKNIESDTIGDPANTDTSEIPEEDCSQMNAQSNTSAENDSADESSVDQNESNGTDSAIDNNDTHDNDNDNTDEQGEHHEAKS